MGTDCQRRRDTDYDHEHSYAARHQATAGRTRGRGGRRAWVSRDDYLVWSNEHRAWWRQNRGDTTRYLADAGRFPEDAALAIAAGGMAGAAMRIGVMPDLPVKAAHVESLAAWYRAAYPNMPPGFWE